MTYVVQVKMLWQGQGLTTNDIASGAYDVYLVNMIRPCPISSYDFTDRPETCKDIKEAFQFNTLAAAETAAVFVGGKVEEA